jgi:hypothetical protein
MRNGTSGGTCARAGGRSDSDDAIVSDLQALMERVQASMRLIEQAIAREARPDDEEFAANLIVLDDVTPLYVTANAALNACRTSLRVAVQFLGEVRPSKGAGGSRADDRQPVRATSRV